MKTQLRPGRLKKAHRPAGRGLHRPVQAEARTVHNLAMI